MHLGPDFSLGAQRLLKPRGVRSLKTFTDLAPSLSGSQFPTCQMGLLAPHCFAGAMKSDTFKNEDF